MTDPLMTEDEHQAMALSAQLANTLARVVADGPTREQDIAELIAPLHAIQHAVMAQAAAREYPHLYRLLGSTLNTLTY